MKLDVPPPNISHLRTSQVPTPFGIRTKISAPKSDVIVALAPLYLAIAKELRSRINDRIIFNDPFPVPTISPPSQLVGRKLVYPFLCVDLASTSFVGHVPGTLCLLIRIHETGITTITDAFPDDPPPVSP
jgi:hypothetical protein